MSQTEVYLLLKDKRLSGIDKYYSIAQICRLILDAKTYRGFIGSHDSRAVGSDVRNLHRIGILEKRSLDNIECFRLRLKSLED